MVSFKQAVIVVWLFANFGFSKPLSADVVYENGFENAGDGQFVTIYTEDNVSVSYTNSLDSIDWNPSFDGSDSGAMISSFFTGVFDGYRAWYPWGGGGLWLSDGHWGQTGGAYGYTKITSNLGVTLNSIFFKFGGQVDDSPKMQLQYALMLDGIVVKQDAVFYESNYAWPPVESFYFGVSGIYFDSILLRAVRGNNLSNDFSDGLMDALILDSIQIQSPSSVPLPSGVWLFAGGLGSFLIKIRLKNKSVNSNFS